MHRIILTERFCISNSFVWPNLIRKKRIEELSVEDVLNKYQGFEGELVCFYYTEKKLLNLHDVINQFLELKRLGNCLILHVISENEDIPSSLQEKTVQLGYDVGVCEKEKTIYSSVFNEILFGNLVELIAYKDLLNENLLFPNRFLAEKYVNLHDDLSAQGKDVEDYEKMTIYKIWKHIS